LKTCHPYLPPQKVSKNPQTYCIHNTLPKNVKSHFNCLHLLEVKILTPKGQFYPIHVDAIILPSISPSSMSLYTTKHFLEVNDEVVILSNGWIWY
jgi:hypothetical protein